jgi:stage IV sporulation protein FB
MFLLEPGRTPYDLNWRMFGIDVRVHPMFWLIGGIMGFDLLAPRPGQSEAQGWALFLLWIVSFFVSILVHEMGHIIMGRWCGNNGHIVMYAFGGLAIPHRPLIERWQRVAVSFAGPLAGFLLFALVAALYFGLGGTDLPLIRNRLANVLKSAGINPGPDHLEYWQHEAIFHLLWINLVWGLVNLLPIWPLDGGQISREICEGTMPSGQGLKFSLGLSLVLAATLAVLILAAAWGRPVLPFLEGFGTYSAVLFGLLAFESFQLLQQENKPRRRPWDEY